MKYGIQMYSLRDLASKDLEEAVKKVASLGYSYVEYAGFFGHTADEVASWQAKYGVECTSTHTGWGEILPDKLEGTIAFHKTIGCKNIIIPGADLSDDGKIAGFVAAVNAALPVIKEAGLTLGYHNHSREFELRPDGRCVWDILAEKTDMLFEIDTFWAWDAGRDPVAMMSAMKDRVRFIHIKDGLRGGKGRTLGKGEAPVREVRRRAAQLGMKIIVESETLTPDGPTEAAECIEYLRLLDRTDPIVVNI